jgi:ABC-2 type transport system ATP-binding protein
MALAVRTERLTKYYGRRRGIIDLNLEVERGEVFGFLGPNGAGKTTTIRLLLDFIRPTRGTAEVLGLRTDAEAVAVHSRTGYLAGEFNLYDRFSGGETIAYFANLRGGVEPAYQRSLVERLGLDPSLRYREYSKGNKQKVALVIAFQHKPALLILDEPTSGLDPLVQQEFLRLLAEARAEGRTVFLSSHVIGEVERSCDRVAIVREGRLVRVDRVEALRDLSGHQVELRFSGPAPAEAFESMPGVSELSANGPVLRMRVAGPIAPVVRAAAGFDLVDMLSREPSLEDVFLAEYGMEAVDVR